MGVCVWCRYGMLLLVREGNTDRQTDRPTDRQTDRQTDSRRRTAGRAPLTGPIRSRLPAGGGGGGPSIAAVRRLSWSSRPTPGSSACAVRPSSCSRQRAGTHTHAGTGHPAVQVHLHSTEDRTESLLRGPPDVDDLLPVCCRDVMAFAFCCLLGARTLARPIWGGTVLRSPVSRVTVTASDRRDGARPRQRLRWA